MAPSEKEELSFQTRCVHTGVNKDTAYNSVITPIYPSSTFYWDDLQTTRGYDYTRSGNPTRTALEENIASLEGGIECRATCTGMAAIATVLYLFKPGDHIIAGDDIYGGTYRLFADVFTKTGIEFSFVKMTDPANIREALRPETKCVWIETPSNPLMNVVDIAAAVGVAKEAGAVTVADNTFLSPYLQRPFEFGVDIVLHSTTKYLNGHSDVVGGCVVTNDKEHAERVGFLVNAMGLGCSPFDAWLVLRGVKTLGPRMEAHQRAALALAEMLDGHDAVERVYYPGLPSHPQYELAKKQQFGFGAMMSFDVKGGRPAAEHVFKTSKLYSLFEYPESMSHASMSLEARREAGITGKTIRVSVGIESPDDLVADMQHALDTIP